MGIGIALASGLVKGFTENIGREMERREAERTRLNTIENAILAAGVGDDFSNKNVAAIKSMLSSAREQDAERGGIDLFGTRGAELIPNDAMSELIGQLQSTAKSDIDEARVFMHDNKPYYTFNREVRNADNTFDATANLSEIAYMIGYDQSAIDKWIAAPDSVKADILQVAEFNASALVIDVEKNRPEGQDKIALDVAGLTGTTDKLDTILGLGIADYGDQSLIGNAYRRNQEKTTGNGDGSGSSGSTIFKKTGVHNIDKPEPGEDAAYNALTVSFGVQAGNLDALNTQWSKYTNVFGMTDADSDALWDKTIQFMTQNDITNQFQDATAFAMMPEAQAKTYLESLRDITRNDMQQMSLILGALYTPRIFKETKETSATRVPNTGSKTITSEDIRLYTAKVLFGAYATEKDFTAIVDQDAQFDKVLSEEVGLGALLTITDEEMQTIPLAYAVASKFAGFKSLARFIFGGEDETTKAYPVSIMAIEYASEGKTIIIDDDKRVVGGRLADQEVIDAGEVMTTGYIDSLNDKISTARQRARRNYDSRPDSMRSMSLEDMEEMYARFESLRISLAFQMARAADPSGRLSDQDVKQMMALLGGDINTPRAMKAKIRRAMEEFEYQRQRFAAVIPFAAASGQATRTDKLRVHGVHALDILSKKAGFLGSSGLEAEVAASQQVTVIQPNETYAGGAVKIGDEVYQSGGNGTWYPEKSFIQVTDETLLKTLNDAMPET